MSIGLYGLLCLTPALAFPAVEGAPKWSSDGRWLAFTFTGTAQGAIPQPGWIFETRPSALLGDSSRPEGTEPQRTALYVAASDREDSWIVEESFGLITTPEWSPEGRSLAYGRVRRSGPGGPERFEIVIHETQGAGRIIDSRPVTTPVAEFDVAKISLAWSPNGHYLAVGLPDSPPRTVVLRSDNGRVLKTIDDAFWPSWSPDSTRLALLRGNEVHSLLMTEAGPGATDRLVELGRVFQPVFWSKDGKSVFCLARRNSVRIGLGSGTIDYLRLNSRTGNLENRLALETDPVTRGRPLQNLTYALDREGVDLFYAREQEGQASSIVWSLPRNPETLARSHPLDRTVYVGALGLSPNSKTLGLRLGHAGVVALWDYPKDRLAPFVPDDAARIAWLTLLRDTSRRVLGTLLLPVAVLGKPVTRPTLFLVPGEVASNHETVFRLRRLARTARPLCEPDAADPRLARFFLECRLYFDMLLDDYASALRSLDRLDELTELPDQRLALLALRAQILLARGEWDRAREPIDYLVELDKQIATRFEVTPAGISLTPEPRPAQGWGKYLAQRADDLAKPRKNMNNPQVSKPPGVDLDQFLRPGRFGNPVEVNPGLKIFRAPNAPAHP